MENVTLKEQLIIAKIMSYIQLNNFGVASRCLVPGTLPTVIGIPLMA